MPAEHVRFDAIPFQCSFLPALFCRHVRMLTIVLLPLFTLSSASAAPPDTLSIQDKAQIIALAEYQLETFIGVLMSITDYSVESESDAQDLEGILDGITKGDDRVFYSEGSIIQDNIDPELKPGMPGIDRKVDVYMTDFFTNFRKESDVPISMELLERGEPSQEGGLVIARLLYSVKFTGKHKSKTTPYISQRRIARFIAERKNSRDWKVYLAADDYQDVVQGFVGFKLDQQLKAAESSGNFTSTMRAYQAAVKAAADKAVQEREDRRKKYTDEITRGDELLAAGDEELAIIMYDQAEKTDPLSTAHIIQKKKAQRQLLAKAKAAQSRALDSLAADLARQLESRGIKSVVVKEFKEESGFQSALGKNLTQQLNDRLAKSAHEFKVLPLEREAKAQALITGNMIRSGENNEVVTLATRIQDVKRMVLVGSSQHEFPVVRDAAPTAASDPKPPDTSGPVTFDQGQKPPPGTAPAKTKRWGIGATAGLNYLSLSATDVNTEDFSSTEMGVRAGIEVERSLSESGKSRFATGARFSVYRCTTGEADSTARKFQSSYAQLPLLLRFFTGESGIGRVGFQIGVLAGVRIGNWTFAESKNPNEYVGASYMTGHASPGICYESPAIGKMRIVANASYDLMLAGFGGQNESPTTEPGQNATSFAIGVMF